MSLVHKELSIPRRNLVNGDIGLEIEVEGYQLPTGVDMWRTEADGSLRGEESCEYVLTKPVNTKGLLQALNNLDSAYIKYKSRVDDTVRAGVHVHINCQHLTMTHLYNFMTVYLVLENVLVHWCGDYREGNLFCLRSCDADYVLQIIRASTDKEARKQLRRLFRNDDIRYASMNLKALADYGSLEFRAMRSTRDLSIIAMWAETLLGLREFAKQFSSPAQVLEEFSLRSPMQFMEDALGNNFKEFVTKDTKQHLHEGMRSAQDIAFCTDWMEFEPKMKMIGNLEFPVNLEEPDEPEDDF